MSARDEWGWYAKHGARGIPGSAALAAELERIVRETGIKSPITTPRGLVARLHYLDTDTGRQALREAGVRPGTLRRWQQGKAKPSKGSREKVERAYHDVPQRSIRIRDWAIITHAWAAGDDAQLDQAWGDIIAEIASEYVAYAYVSGIGIGA